MGTVKNQSWIPLSIVALALASFWLGGNLKERQYDAYFSQTQQRRITFDPYPLVAPLVGTESPSALEVGRLKDIYSAIKKFADANSRDVQDYSVYFRDLSSAQWFGINENEGYIPASLLKISLAIALLKQEEDTPALRNTKKTYTADIAAINTSVAYLEPTQLKVGQSYTTDDLLYKMMVDSDNGAKDLIYSQLNKDAFINLFKVLGVEEPTDPARYTLSTKDFAFFLRILYNGTYLSSENSQKLLDLMTQSTFTQGLVAGVPKQVIVAHKFGTFTIPDQNGNPGTIELHDCGIVYNDDYPYLLCVMTKGKDANKLASFIAGMSRVTYQAVQEYYAQ